jgi:hypothetical protein
MQTSGDVRRAAASYFSAGPSHAPAADARPDIFEALMEALNCGERYLLVECDGELHLIARGE